MLCESLISRHAEYTGSTVAAQVLANWSEVMRTFVKVMPREADFPQILTVHLMTLPAFVMNQGRFLV